MGTAAGLLVAGIAVAPEVEVARSTAVEWAAGADLVVAAGIVAAGHLAAGSSPEEEGKQSSEEGESAGCLGLDWAVVVVVEQILGSTAAGCRRS